MSDDRTLVTFLLDETGSMGSIKDDTIGGFNEYLKKLKTSATPIDFTLIKFDSNHLVKVCVAKPVADVAELNDNTYTPGASTPLIDAAFKTIKAVEKSLNGSTPKVVICIQTDGEENASTEHTWDELNALIKEKTGLGWQFNFLGTGIDAYATGQRMGVAAANTMSTGRSSANVRSSLAAAASNTMAFASGASLDSAFSDDQRGLAGDQFYKGLDLTAGQPKATVVPPAPAKKDPHKAVDDFSL